MKTSIFGFFLFLLSTYSYGESLTYTCRSFAERDSEISVFSDVLLTLSESNVEVKGTYHSLKSDQKIWFFENMARNLSRTAKTDNYIKYTVKSPLYMSAYFPKNIFKKQPKEMISDFGFLDNEIGYYVTVHGVCLRK